MPREKSQGFFNFELMMPLHKTEDQIKIERILADEQRKYPPTETDAVVEMDIRKRMAWQRMQNERAARGIVSVPDRRR